MEKTPALKIMEGAVVLRMLSEMQKEEDPDMSKYLRSVAYSLYETIEGVDKKEDEYCDEEGGVGADGPSGLVIAIGLSEPDKRAIGRNFTYLTFNPYPKTVPEDGKRYLVKTERNTYEFMYYNKARGTWTDPANDYCDCYKYYVRGWLELV